MQWKERSVFSCLSQFACIVGKIAPPRHHLGRLPGSDLLIRIITTIQICRFQFFPALNKIWRKEKKRRINVLGATKWNKTGEAYLDDYQSRFISWSDEDSEETRRVLIKISENGAQLRLLEVFYGRWEFCNNFSNKNLFIKVYWFEIKIYWLQIIVKYINIDKKENI